MQTTQLSCRNDVREPTGAALQLPLIRSLLGLFLLVLMVCSAGASEDIELDRIIINQTLTKAGYEFFQRFCSLWEEIPGQQTPYTVVVKEVPSVQFGSTISVEINDIVVYRAILRTRSSDVADAAMQAAQNTRLLLLQLEQQQINGSKIEEDYL